MVDVKLYTENSKIIFSVADHGIGISDEEKKLIFKKSSVHQKYQMKKEGKIIMSW